MTKFVKRIWILTCLLLLFCLGVLAADKMVLHNDVIRLHVIADSDEEADQSAKLIVKDALVTYLQNEMTSIQDPVVAKEFLRNNLHNLQSIANAVLESLGSGDTVRVSLKKEAFGTRQYDTFALPAGVYDSLLVEIGAAQGKNWWCVVFPALCVPATTESFEDAAVSAGFDQGLAQSLSGESQLELRFFFLDCLGKLENLFYDA